MKIHIGCLLFLLTTTLFAGPHFCTVISDIANVRAVPEKTGSIVARLLAGSQVGLLDSTGDWYRVNYSLSLGDLSTSHLGKGWLHRATVSSGSVSIGSITDSIKQSKNLTDSILWLERLWNFRGREMPSDSTVKDWLRSSYRRAGDTLRIKWIEEQPPVYLAKVKNRLLCLLGKINMAGDFESLIWTVQSSSELSGTNPAIAQLTPWVKYPSDNDGNSVQAVSNWLRKLEMLRFELAALRWRTVTRGSLFYFFPSPFFTPTNDTAVNRMLDLPIYSEGTYGAIVLDTFCYKWGDKMFCSRPAGWVAVRGPKSNKDWAVITERIAQLADGLELGAS